MKKRFELPDISAAEQTPLVKMLVCLVEQMAETIRDHEETIDVLKDEIQVLKGEKKRPRFKPSKMDQQTEPSTNSSDEPEGKPGKNSQRPGSSKASKTPKLPIDEIKVISPSTAVPPGSRFKGYRDFTVQDLHITPHNTRYRLECWETPAGERLVGQLPSALAGGHYGPTLVSYLLYQHHHCQVTQSLLRSPDELKQLHTLTGGQPYLTQEVLDAIRQPANSRTDF